MYANVCDQKHGWNLIQYIKLFSFVFSFTMFMCFRFDIMFNRLGLFTKRLSYIQHNSEIISVEVMKVNLHSNQNNVDNSWYLLEI